MENMTIFYLKSNGNIKVAATGDQDMNFYGNEKDDMSMIIDYIVVPKDDFVLSNMSLFFVNSLKELKLKNEDLTKYV